MKNRKLYLIIVSLLLIMTIIACVFFLSSRISRLSYLYFSAVGSNAQDCAVLLADRIELSKERFEELKQMSYLETTKTPEHHFMRFLLKNHELSIDIKNIYIMSPLRREEVTYYVPKDKAEFYEAEENTPLDLIYVLDVFPEKYLDKDGNHYKDDMNRYSVQDETTKEHLEAKKQTYEYAIDEWGTTITGYAPLYATDSEYLGLVGVDVTPDTYLSFNDKAVTSIFLVFLCSIGLLIVEMIYVLTVLNRMQADRVYLDPMTSVYNRRYLNEKLPKVLKKKGRRTDQIVIALLDIDLFKEYNDVYGHNTGDECLIKFASEVKKALPSKLGHLIRYGGEEFVACFSANSEEEIQRVLMQMQERIAGISLDEATRAVTCSIGCCYCTFAVLEKTPLDQLLKLADQNLYYVKENGRNDYRISNYISKN